MGGGGGDDSPGSRDSNASFGGAAARTPPSFPRPIGLGGPRTPSTGGSASAERSAGSFSFRGEGTPSPPKTSPEEGSTREKEKDAQKEGDESGAGGSSGAGRRGGEPGARGPEDKLRKPRTLLQRLMGWNKSSKASRSSRAAAAGGVTGEIHRNVPAAGFEPSTLASPGAPSPPTSGAAPGPPPPTREEDRDPAAGVVDVASSADARALSEWRSSSPSLGSFWSDASDVASWTGVEWAFPPDDAPRRRPERRRGFGGFFGSAFGGRFGAFGGGDTAG